MLVVLLFLVTAAGGLSAGYFLRRYTAKKKLRDAEAEAHFIIEKAKKEAKAQHKEAELEARDKMLHLRSEFENQTKERRSHLNELEKKLAVKETNLERRWEMLEKKEKEEEGHTQLFQARENDLKAKEQKLYKLIAEEKERLQRISSLSIQEARQILLNRISEDLDSEKAALIRKQEEEVRLQSRRKALDIISSAIQRYAADHTAESTVSVVALPSDEMKGRVIGREGRNIRALEMATGVDVIIDDTPETVTLSSFDPIRREIARRSLEKLISDGRIHPTRIEEVVTKTSIELEETVQQKGEALCYELGVEGLHPELIKLVGRLYFRTSYSQNAYYHSKEVAYLLGTMAGELGADVRLARRIGLLHDIGKSVDQTQEGTHARIGAVLVKKYGESDEIVHAVESHHEEQTPKTIYAILTVAADAISAARPGARKEMLESYIQRLEKLEAIANDFRGVKSSYAIQAGREIRVIIQPERVSDDGAVTLAREIKKKVEENLEYPGQIKVTVVRELRAIEYAK